MHSHTFTQTHEKKREVPSFRELIPKEFHADVNILF